MLFGGTARSRGARAPDSRPSGRAGVSGELETAVKGKDGRRGGRADHGDLGRRRLDLACLGRNGLPHAATTHCGADGTGYPATGGLWAGAGQWPRCVRIFAITSGCSIFGMCAIRAASQSHAEKTSKFRFNVEAKPRVPPPEERANQVRPSLHMAGSRVLLVDGMQAAAECDQ